MFCTKSISKGELWYYLTGRWTYSTCSEQEGPHVAQSLFPQNHFSFFFLEILFMFPWTENHRFINTSWYLRSLRGKIPPLQNLNAIEAKPARKQHTCIIAIDKKEKYPLCGLQCLLLWPQSFNTYSCRP